MRRPVTAILANLVALALPLAAPAQTPTTGGFVLSYDPDERPLFEAGYRRHLEWHRQHQDSLSWFGWDVLVGPRPGLFVDGVFGVPFAALDARVDPAGDGADAEVNVLPYADPVSREMLALRPDLGTATPLEDGDPTLFVEVIRFSVRPSSFAGLEAALGTLRDEGDPGLLPYTVYERVAGAAPGFVLMIWRERLESFDAHILHPARTLRRMLATGVEDGGPVQVEGSESEVWMYRRDLSHLGTSREER